ncbi:hypothetical protein JCM30471_14870 [Desulfuromonas carbonis]|uniref:hypothetical protein n=1 Tax=Desulfuromonas sp. DDH964 TaxID=1823759 RepID=UPI00078C397B|nr:hypothetical protein [Desulfuromonas sp. DDH964]AMV73072.1 hypothetical protein DBW_2762 [Desulfuromonas sp. DDH964]
MNIATRFALLVLILVVSASLASAAPFTGYRLLKISAADQRAVIQQPDGALKAIGTGDGVDGARVTEIAEGRVVLEGKDGETVVVRLEKGRQRIETYQRLGESAPPMTVPADGDAGLALPSGSGARQ